MRFGRTLPPAASPIPRIDIFRALPACLRPGATDGHLTQEIMREYGSKYCFLLSSGKAALTLSLLALKKIYPERDQVVIPAFTCYSVPAAVKRAGLQIRLCDLAPSSLDFDKEQLQGIIAEDKQEKKFSAFLSPICLAARQILPLFGLSLNLKYHSLKMLPRPWEKHWTTRNSVPWAI